MDARNDKMAKHTSTSMPVEASFSLSSFRYEEFQAAF